MLAAKPQVVEHVDQIVLFILRFYFIMQAREVSKTSSFKVVVKEACLV